MVRARVNERNAAASQKFIIFDRCCIYNDSGEIFAGA